MTQIGGSLVGLLAHLEDAIDAEALYDVATLDERFQAEQWGEDEEAAERLKQRGEPVPAELEAAFAETSPGRIALPESARRDAHRGAHRPARAADR